MKYFVCILFVSYSLHSQETLWDNFLKKKENLLLEQKKSKDLILNNFYNKDFNVARKGVDLSKIKLEPSKAEQNKYSFNGTDRDLVVFEVNKYLGVPYLWGGNNPKAFDCSGLVKWTLKKSHGIDIPRTTLDQYLKWSNFLNFNLKFAKPGDLVYFKTKSKIPVSHVGVYLGDNKFIHSPKSNDFVRISSLENYWKDKFIGFVSLNTILEM